MVTRFEQAAATKELGQESSLSQLTEQLSPCNRTLLAWVILHLEHISERV